MLAGARRQEGPVLCFGCSAGAGLPHAAHVPRGGDTAMRTFLGVLTALLLAGCQPPQQQSAPSAADNPSGKLRIAVIPKGTTHEFWKSVHYGADQAAEELATCEILW